MADARLKIKHGNSYIPFYPFWIDKVYEELGEDIAQHYFGKIRASYPKSPNPRYSDNLDKRIIDDSIDEGGLNSRGCCPDDFDGFFNRSTDLVHMYGNESDILYYNDNGKILSPEIENISSYNPATKKYIPKLEIINNNPFPVNLSYEAYDRQAPTYQYNVVFKDSTQSSTSKIWTKTLTLDHGGLDNTPMRLLVPIITYTGLDVSEDEEKNTTITFYGVNNTGPDETLYTNTLYNILRNQPGNIDEIIISYRRHNSVNVVINDEYLDRKLLTFTFSFIYWTPTSAQIATEIESGESYEFTNLPEGVSDMEFWFTVPDTAYSYFARYNILTSNESVKRRVIFTKYEAPELSKNGGWDHLGNRANIIQNCIQTFFKSGDIGYALLSDVNDAKATKHLDWNWGFSYNNYTHIIDDSLLNPGQEYFSWCSFNQSGNPVTGYSDGVIYCYCPSDVVSITLNEYPDRWVIKNIATELYDEGIIKIDEFSKGDEFTQASTSNFLEDGMGYIFKCKLAQHASSFNIYHVDATSSNANLLDCFWNDTNVSYEVRYEDEDTYLYIPFKVNQGSQSTYVTMLLQIEVRELSTGNIESNNVKLGFYTPEK